MVAPVLNARGEVVCVLIGVLRLYKDNLLGHLRNAKVGRTGYYFALTREANRATYCTRMPNGCCSRASRMPTRPRRARSNRASKGLSMASTAAASALSTVTSAARGGLAAGRFVAGQEAFEPFHGAVERLLWWSGLAALLAALLIGWLTMHLLAPLVRLRDAIVALRAKPAGYTPLPVATDDEVGQLTSAFNALMQERLAADARLQNLVEYAPNAILVVDGSGRIETMNREAERCFVYARAKFWGGP
jgi:PAS domain-containing protein